MVIKTIKNNIKTNGIHKYYKLWIDFYTKNKGIIVAKLIMSTIRWCLYLTIGIIPSLIATFFLYFPTRSNCSLLICK